jgi:adenosylcobinamide-GDP ribazoletransferase
VAAIIGLLIATVCLGIAGPIAMLMSALLAIALRVWAERALGGVSGDVLGAIEQLAEITTMLTATALIGAGLRLPLG